MLARVSNIENDSKCQTVLASVSKQQPMQVTQPSGQIYIYYAESLAVIAVLAVISVLQSWQSYCLAILLFSYPIYRAL